MNKSKQRGLGFTGFIAGAFILVFVSIIGMKIIPAYMQNAQISSILNAIVNDPELSKTNKADIRMSFTKRATINSITAIHADDIEIANEGGRLVLSASYSVKMPMVSNISLCMDFVASSAK